MRKLILAALAALMILTLLGGCRLAVDDDEMNPGTDRLCGVFVTLDYLDISFEDQELEIPPNWNGDPSSIVFPEARIYATRTEEEDGSVDYTFDGIDGFRLFSVKIDSPDGLGSYSSSFGDDALQDGHFSLSDEEINLSGTIYFDGHYPCHIYTNPVYQTPDGAVYMMQGQGLFFDESQTEGSVGSTSLSATTTENNNGEETSYTIKVEIKVEAVNTNKKVLLKQLDSSDQIIMQTEITQDDIPESIKIEKNTAYMIMEEHCIDHENKASVKRTLLKPDEEFLDARFTGDNGIIETYPVTLEHAGKAKDSLL